MALGLIALDLVEGEESDTASGGTEAGSFGEGELLVGVTFLEPAEPFQKKK